jgi:hypothetical protein
LFVLSHFKDFSMLFRVDVQQRTVSQVAATSLVELQLWERHDLQEWVLHTPQMLGEDLLIITSEFDHFNRTSERLDVLALDKQGKLVVVELKRSAVGTAAELQALRYAAFCSTLSLDDLTELHRDYLRRRGQPEYSTEQAAERIAAFVEQPSFSALDNQPRIILAAEEFPAEITATVLWLRSFDMDIRCLRLRPYLIEDQLVLESSVLIPLPEAEEFLIRRERKDAEQAVRGDRRPIEPEEFLATVPEGVRPTFLRIRNWLVSRNDLREAAFKFGLTYRRASDRKWATWLEFTRNEVRMAIRPDVSVDPVRVVRYSSIVGGYKWPIISARTDDDAAEAERLLTEAIEHLDDRTEPSVPGQHTSGASRTHDNSVACGCRPQRGGSPLE